VAIEKVAFLEKLSQFGDRCPGDPRESFIAHPDAILFSRFSREGVFSAATPAYNNDRLVASDTAIRYSFR
jgi:hypothetical protein